MNLHVYAGTAGHSAWFSKDGGLTWVHPNSHSGLYLEARVWCFSAHPRAPRWLYAGTDLGLYRFDEETLRWQAIASPMGDVWAVAQDPRDPDRLLCGTRPAAFWRSDDAGRTWRALAAPGMRAFSEVNMGPTRVTQLLHDPADEATVWASVEIGGILRSRDRGETWTLCERGLISTDVHGIAVVPAPDGKRVWATTNRGLHLSRDDGESWEFHRLDSSWQYTRAIVPSAADPMTLFLTNGDGPPGSTGRLLRSRDGGLSWAGVELPGTLNSTPWCVAGNAADPRLLFLCTNLGQLYRSDDGGERWRRLPHEFGEVRALAWRELPDGMGAGAEHSITKRPPPPA